MKGNASGAAMKVNQNVSFMSGNAIESSAYALLRRYSENFEPIAEPPVPVERIADLLLELTPDWGPIEDEEDNPILAFIDPEASRIRINERHLERFAAYPGMLEFTIGHEIGHNELHILKNGIEQLELDFGDSEVHDAKSESTVLARLGVSPKGYLCRDKASSGVKDMREKQADQFASYLLMPEYLLRPAIAHIDLLSWPSLYRLRDLFNVSITALKIRLGNLGLLYVAPDGSLHRSEVAANGMNQLL